jgi:hypothetical protein
MKDKMWSFLAYVLSSVDGRKRVIAIICYTIGFVSLIFPSTGTVVDELKHQFTVLIDMTGTIIGGWAIWDAKQKGRLIIPEENPNEDDRS